MTMPIEAKLMQRMPVLANSGINTASNTAGTCVLTFPAPGAKKAWVLPGIFWSYGGTGTLSGGNVTVTDGTDTFFTIDFAAKGNGYIDLGAIEMPENYAMVITLANGGTDVAGKLNAYPYLIFVPAAGTTGWPGSLLYSLDFSSADNSMYL